MDRYEPEEINGILVFIPRYLYINKGGRVSELYLLTFPNIFMLKLNDTTSLTDKRIISSFPNSDNEDKILD